MTTVTHCVVTQRDGTQLYFEGQLIGRGTSERPKKMRWFEVDIYLRTDGGENTYIVQTRGMTRLEGERTLFNVVQTSSPIRLFEALIVTRDGKTYLTSAAIDALNDAVEHNDHLAEAYAVLPSGLFEGS